jgi:L-fucose isomerase-like protein
MSKKRSVLLGVCPIGKFVFSHEDAIRQKNAILERLDSWGINYVTIDEVLPDDQGIVRDQAHVEPVVAYLQAKKIDALFIPHCNFGTEGAAGMIAKKLGVPVLLWGPRDEAPLPDGSRYRDSLCGMFATSKVLHKLQVPFTYIENCWIDDPKFKDGLALFLRASSVVKAMRNMRIGQVGVRVDFFWTTISNESELLQKFGIELYPFDMADFIRDVKARAKANWQAYQEELETYRASWLVTENFDSDDGLIHGLAMRDELFHLAERYDLDGFAIKSFTSLGTELGAGIGIGDMFVQERYPIGAETDIHGAISSVLLEAATWLEEPSFFPEFTVRHPENENAIMLWHGDHPYSLRHPSVEKVRIYPPWILKGLPPSSPKMQLKDGPLTVCRFDGENGSYVLGIGEGHSVPGPETRESWVWMEVDNWPRWERRIMEGPYIHHCSAVYDHCADALQEACKYIPGLTVQRFDGP